MTKKLPFRVESDNPKIEMNFKTIAEALSAVKAALEEGAKVINVLQRKPC